MSTKKKHTCQLVKKSSLPVSTSTTQFKDHDISRCNSIQEISVAKIEPVKYMPTAHCLENPGLIKDGANFAVSSIDFTKSWSCPDIPRHCKRMCNESAAAIAAQRNRQSTPDDKELRMDNENIVSEVIYNERTVL